jgi:hypothetical protein
VLLNQGPQWVARDHSVAKMSEPRTNFVEQATIWLGAVASAMGAGRWNGV